MDSSLPSQLMASPAESGSRGIPELSLQSIPKSPSVSEWLAAIDASQSALDGLPADSSTDLQRATAVLILAHLRYRAPIPAIWQKIQSPNWPEAVRAIEHLAPPVRWALSTATAARFAKTGNEAGFDAAIRIVKAFRFPVTMHEEIAHGALLACIEHRPALLGELLRCGALKSPTPLASLARSRPAALVGEVFQGVEQACCNCDPESTVGRAIWKTRRWDVALACLASIEHDSNENTAAKRRDYLREVAARAMAKDGRLQQAADLLMEAEDRERGVCRAVVLLCNFNSPDIAYDLWKGSAYCRKDPFLARDIALAFAKQGRVTNALEVAAQAGGTKSERSEIVASALKEALKAGAVSDVAAALDQVPSKRERAKLEQAVARAGGTLEPKELRARAESLAMRAATPQMAASAATQIALMLPDAKAPDSIFIRAALVHALAKADLHEVIGEHLSAATAAVPKVSRSKVCHEAAAAVFASAVAAGRFAEGQAMIEALEDKFADHDQVNEFLFNVVEECRRVGVIEQLKAAIPVGSEAWVIEGFEEILTWQGVSEGNVDQLVKKAMKRSKEYERNLALGDIIRDLEAHGEFPKALAVLRRMSEPHSPVADRIGFARRAAEGGFPRVAEEILDIVESGWRAKAEGRNPQEKASTENQLWQDIKKQALEMARVDNPALAELLGELAEEDEQSGGTHWNRRECQQVRERTFEVRSAFELANGDEDALVSVAEGIIELYNKAMWKAAKEWLETMRLNFRPDAKSRGSTQWRTNVEGAGGLDAAIQRQLQEGSNYCVPETLIGLARYAAAQESLMQRVPEILAHALSRLSFTEQNTSRDPRGEIANIAEFIIHGYPIPEFPAKADELLNAIANGYFLRPAHLVRVLAALERWPEAFKTLERVLPVIEDEPAPYQQDRASTACHLLLTAPLDVIRAQASVFSDHLELAWLYTAAIGMREGEETQLSFLKRSKKSSEGKTGFLLLLQTSDRLLEGERR